MGNVKEKSGGVEVIPADKIALNEAIATFNIHYSFRSHLSKYSDDEKTVKEWGDLFKKLKIV